MIKTLGVILATILLPFVLEIISFALEVRYEGNKPIQFAIHFAELILLFVLLWIIFNKAKEKILADAYMAGVCLIAALIGLCLFGVFAHIAPGFEGNYHLLE